MFEASRPLAQAPAYVKPAPVAKAKRRPRHNDLDMVWTTDVVLGIIGLLWLAVMAWYGYEIFYKDRRLDLYLILAYVTLAVPNVVCFLTAIIRMAWFGSPYLAAACFSGGFLMFMTFLTSSFVSPMYYVLVMTLGIISLLIGELVAVIASSSNPSRWRLEGMFPIWMLSFVGTFLLVVSIGGRIYYLKQHGAPGAQPQIAASSLWGGSSTAARRAQFPTQSSGPSSQQPPSPFTRPSPTAPPAPRLVDNSHLGVLEQLVTNRQSVVNLLATVVDRASAKSAWHQYVRLDMEHKRVVVQPYKADSTAKDVDAKIAATESKRSTLDAKIASEIARVRAIPGAGHELGIDTRDTAYTSSDASSNAAPSDTGKHRPSMREERPKPKTPEEKIDRAIEDLTEGDVWARREAAKTLRTADFLEEKHEQVAKALEVGLAENDSFAEEDIAAAFGVWGTKKNVPAIIDMLEGSRWGHGDSRKHAIRALAKLKDERGAVAIVAALSSKEGLVAVQALKDMGPVAEDAVLPQLENDDPKMRFQVCGILQEIGTADSIDNLKRHSSGDRVPEVKKAAREAIKAIEERGGKVLKPATKSSR